MDVGCVRGCQACAAQPTASAPPHAGAAEASTSRQAEAAAEATLRSLSPALVAALRDQGPDALQQVAAFLTASQRSQAANRFAGPDDGVRQPPPLRLWPLGRARPSPSLPQPQRSPPSFGPSSCGALAVAKVLDGLRGTLSRDGVDVEASGGWPGMPSDAAILAAVPVKRRLTSGCLVPYLLSRSRAGTTAQELQHSVRILSGGAIDSRFYPGEGRRRDWVGWAKGLLRDGAVVLATLNLQRLMGTPLADAWHHEVLLDCSSEDGLVMASDESGICAAALERCLDSPSVLRVAAEDVLRFLAAGPGVDVLWELLEAGPAWAELNVAAQLASLLRDRQRPPALHAQLPPISHITVPAAYTAGLTVFAHKDAPLWQALPPP